MNSKLAQRTACIFLGIACAVFLVSWRGGGDDQIASGNLHTASANTAAQSTGGSGGNGRLVPADMYAHYSVPLTGGAPTYGGTGQTIAIVDAPGLNSQETIISDLNAFTAYVGMASSDCKNPVLLSIIPGNKITTYDCNGFKFKIIDQNIDPANKSNVDGEIALDVQWSHAMAPNADLVLVLASSGKIPDMAFALDTAAGHSGVTAVSLSYAWSESILPSSETSLIYDSHVLNDGLFAHWTAQGIVFFASAGDTANSRFYPAASPYVTSVGGTAIVNTAALMPTQSSPNAPSSQSGYEVAWSSDSGVFIGGTGGGTSLYEPMPNFQRNFLTTSLAGSLALNAVGSNRMRAIPDVAYNANADISPVVRVLNGVVSGDGGTSEGAPQWAGIFAQMADYYSRKSSPSPAPLNLKLKNTVNYPYGFNSYLYSIYTGISASSPFFDITKGTNINATNPNSAFYSIGGFQCTGLCAAGVGYDNVSGLGAPVVSNLLGGL